MIALILHFKAVLCGYLFVLRTDHAVLQYVYRGTSVKVTRWRLLLQELDCIVRHLIELADFLSRTPSPSRKELTAPLEPISM